MARVIFPDQPFIFRTGPLGTPIYSTDDDTLTVYLDDGATELADLLHSDMTTPVYQSSFVLDQTSTIPFFYGPDGVTTLYGKTETGTPFPIYALSGPRLDRLENTVIVNPVTLYTETIAGAVTENVPCSVTHNLGNQYPIVEVWYITEPGKASKVFPSEVITLSLNALTFTTVSSYSAGTLQITVAG